MVLKKNEQSTQHQPVYSISDIEIVKKRHEQMSQHEPIKGSHIEAYHRIMANYFSNRNLI